MNDTLTVLFQHNLWANDRLFTLCETLTREQLDAKIIGTYGTVRETLQHLATSERSYLYRIQTRQSFRRSESESELSVADLLLMIRESGLGLVSAAPEVGQEDEVTVDWKGTPRQVPLTIFLTQVINHATEHRAQIAATLTHLGIEPPAMDAWSYFESL